MCKKMETAETIDIMDLPVEMVNKILSYLSYDQVAHMRLVSICSTLTCIFYLYHKLCRVDKLSIYLGVPHVLYTYYVMHIRVGGFSQHSVIVKLFLSRQSRPMLRSQIFNFDFKFRTYIL